MVSFKEKLEQKQELHAYVLGAKAAMDGYSTEVNPFHYDVFVAQEWLDGYLDAVFLRSV
jgi:ribosome modulation factor